MSDISPAPRETMAANNSHYLRPLPGSIFSEEVLVNRGIKVPHAFVGVHGLDFGDDGAGWPGEMPMVRKEARRPPQILRQHLLRVMWRYSPVLAPGDTDVLI